MKEVKTELKAYQVEFFCDCGGALEFSGEAYLTMPPQYPHFCKQCKKRVVLMEKNNSVRYEKIS